MTETTQQTRPQAIVADLDTNVEYVNRTLGIGTSWDLIAKPFSFAGVRMMSYVANGYFLTMNMVLVLENVETCIRSFVESRPQQPLDLHALLNYLSERVAFVQVQPVDQMDDVLRYILSGPMVTFIDGIDKALLIDTRIYPMRSITTPDLERTVRGSRDAFTETMLMNTAMIRRRLRDPRLRNELMQIGVASKTDVSLLYVEGVTDPHLVNDVRQRLRSIDVDGLFMSNQTLVEHLAQVGWNPYPVARYTERPDVAAVALMEGQVVIVVDNSPNVIILPTAYVHHLQHPQEFQSYPLTGTYTRVVLIASLLIHVFLPGVFLLLNAHPEMMPRQLAFLRADRNDPLPLWMELVIAEFGMDILQLAVINSPKELASSIGIVAALLFGQFATTIHFLQPEVLVYMGLVMTAQLAMSSWELGTANQMARLWLIGWTASLGAIGFLVAVLSWLVVLLRMHSFGLPYLWPLTPFQWRNGLREVLLRRPMQAVHNLPNITPALQRQRGVRSILGVAETANRTRGDWRHKRRVR
ncbi:MAG: spore germination protein [Alicyclobacillus sp.]|nr:spore germination protein [Alicyclobacillus sp.]